MPIGTLMKKIQCQLRASVSSPPVSRPIEPPATLTKVNADIAFRRSLGIGNSTTIRARIAEEQMALPKPCTKRAAISVASLSAMPQRIEATTKIEMPARNMRVRPTRSPKRPPSSRKLP